MKTPKVVLAALAVFATVGLPLAIDAIPQTASAQTQGMDRRGGRRDTRQDSRQVKHDCKSGGNSRSDCRQEKRDTKQAGRHGQTTSTNPPR